MINKIHIKLWQSILLFVSILILAISFNNANAISLDNVLLQACETNDIEIASYALSLGANPNYIKMYGSFGPESPLNMAVQKNNYKMVALLLDNGAKIGSGSALSKKNELLFRPLRSATPPHIDSQILQLLLEHTETLPEREWLISNVAFMLAFHGREKLLLSLAEKGADLAYVTEKGLCVPLEAAAGGHMSLATRLIEMYRDRLALSPHKELLTHNLVEYAAGSPWEEDNIISIVNSLSALGFKFSEGRSLLYGLVDLARALGLSDEDKIQKAKSWRINHERTIDAAVRKLDLDKILTLIDQLIDTNEEKKKLLAMVLVAYGDVATGGNKTILSNIERLIELGIDINVVSTTWPQSSPTTLLFQVIANHGDKDLLEWLLDHGADINLRVQVHENFTLSPLDIAIARNPEAIHFLLELGAEVEDRSNNYSALLVLLKQHKSGVPPNIVKMIIDAGADPYFKGKDSLSAVDIAADRLDIMLLRQLDFKGHQKELLATYTHAESSPLIGLWSNNRDGFNTFSVSLSRDGFASVNGAVVGISGVWRESSAKEAVIEVREPEQGHATQFKVYIDSNDGNLHFYTDGEKAKDKDQVLRRVEGEPPSFQSIIDELEQREKVLKERSKKTEQRKIESQKEKDKERAILLQDFQNAILLDNKDPSGIKISANRNLIDNHLRQFPESSRERIGATEINARDKWMRELPDWFGGFTNLKILSLDGNVFTSVPPVLRELIKLQYISLSYNQISELPEWFNEIGGGNIKNLNLSWNNLSEVPPQLADSNSLEELSLSGNNIKSIPDFLANLPRLKIISLADNPIAAEERERFEKLLGRKLYW